MTNMNELLEVEPLTADSIRELRGKTYNKEGKPDWFHIFPYNHDEIIFQDSIQRIEGIEEFKELCQCLMDRCEQLSMDIFMIAESPGSFFFDWEMVMTFRKWPSSSIFGMTKLTIGEDNCIIKQRDYFDLWGDIVNNIPFIHNPYRRFMKRYFV